MQSFTNELENPLVAKEILDLEKKIRQYRDGQLHEDKFRSLRLARGVYGQRQQGVQMVRIKLPFGRVTVKQLLKIADISDEYAVGNLHLTTRQDIQLHFVSLDRTPELWAKLAEDDITLREACGNTVRNITASYTAGVDPEEPFDVSPYAYTMFQYFLRNPICQEMGRKFKISFSSSDKDSAYSFMHDLGFIPKVQYRDGKEVRGFKVLVGGGLGAQPYLAYVGQEFIEANKIIPFAESVIRVFDRYGERTRRHKARMKFLIDDIGFETFMDLVQKEHRALKNHVYEIDPNAVPAPVPPVAQDLPEVTEYDKAKYEAWLKTNVFEQKQKGFYGVQLKIQLGDLKTTISRQLASLVQKVAADDMRISVNQGILLKYVREESLLYVFSALDKMGLAEPGFDSTADVTACPGTDTCNLAISSSTGISVALEEVMKKEYPDLIYNSDIKIKISGCMNACGQHTAAQIGYHGSSIKKGPNVLPALQLLLGGGIEGDGVGSIADKVIKIPSKKGPDSLRYLLNDYETHALDGEYFNDYYRRKGKDYFYQLLKPLADTSALTADDFVDWGHEDKFATAIGVGECAGVMIDLVATLFFEAEEKLAWAKEAMDGNRYADSIYYSYQGMIASAKAFLLTQDINGNSHHHIMNEFDKNAVENGVVSLPTDFRTLVMQINANDPSAAFAQAYLQEAVEFYELVVATRKKLQAQEILK